MDLQKCTQCCAVLPFSKISKHIQLQHSGSKNSELTSQADDTFSNEDFGAEEVDFELNDDDEDVKDFLENTKNSSDFDMTGVSEGEEELHINPKTEFKEDIVAGDEAGDSCPMCCLSVPLRAMTKHLAEIHFVRVLSWANWNDSSVPDDPFGMPDFLVDERKEKPEVKCHHCQKRYPDSERLRRHVERRHGESCRVCRVQRLVRQNRFSSKMKLGGSSRSFREDSISLNSSINRADNCNIVYNYEELYPEEKVRECEECEADFSWPEADHSCSLVRREVRLVAGRQVSGRSISGERELGEEREFQYAGSQLAQSLVMKKSLETIQKKELEARKEIQILLAEIVEDVIEGKTDAGKDLTSRDPIKLEDLELQLSGQILCYRHLLRHPDLPDLVLKAGKLPQFFSLNERRKLNGFMLEEYKDSVESSRKIEFSKNKKDTKQRNNPEQDNNTVKTFDYSRYTISNIQLNKKLKTDTAKPFLHRLAHTKSRGVFSDLKRQQQRRITENSVLKPQKVSRVKLPTNTSLERPRLPTRISEVTAGAKLLPPAPTVTIQKVSPRLPSSLERLQSLGLSVSVRGTNVPESSPPATSVSTRSRTTIVKKIVRRPSVSLTAGEQFKTQKKIQAAQPQVKPNPDDPTLTIKKVFPPPPPPEFPSNRKMQMLLKFQILAYRMLKRREKLPDVVLKVSSNTDIKMLKLSKTEQRDLKYYLNVEYNAL